MEGREGTTVALAIDLRALVFLGVLREMMYYSWRDAQLRNQS